MINEIKPLELLIVEDSERHRADAMHFIADIQSKGIAVNVDYASCKDDALDLLEKKAYSGVITDIFMPSTSAGAVNQDDKDSVHDVILKYNEKTEFLESWKSINPWLKGNELPPLGVLIAEAALEKQIPVVFCTDTYHHGNMTQPVYTYSNERLLPMADVIDDDTYLKKVESSSSSKHWSNAYCSLLIDMALQGPQRLKDIGKKIWSMAPGEEKVSFYEECVQSSLPLFERFSQESINSAQEYIQDRLTEAVNYAMFNESKGM